MSSYTIAPLRNPSSIYFGKIPSRGDFVKSMSGTKVITLIDNWVAQGMEMLLAEPDWKNYYDNAGSIDFLFLGINKRHAISGALLPSSDASSRRFPFIAATLFETEESLSFLPMSPLVLERHGNRQRALIQHATQSLEASEILASLNDMPLDDSDDISHPQNYRQFLASTSIDNLAQSLKLRDADTTVRHMVLAVGYLLQPVLTNYSIPPQKGLSIPMPADPLQGTLVKSFWLDLIGTFLGRAEFELSIFSCHHFGDHKLIITFNGVPPNIFKALFDAPTADEHLIDIGKSAWVDEYAMQDLATIKLSSYLNHGDLLLEQVVQTFRQGFTGQ